MANQLVLRKDWPGYPAGTVMTKSEDGRYYAPHPTDPTRQLFLDQSEIDKDVFGFEVYRADPQAPVLADKATYFFLTDTGDVDSAIVGLDQAADDARVAFGNYFQTEDLALLVAKGAAASLLKSPHGVIE